MLAGNVEMDGAADRCAGPDNLRCNAALVLNDVEGLAVEDVRIERSGRTTQYALGMRNPYDLVWDPQTGQLVVADNGPTRGDEVHVIEAGANCEPPAPR